jgi:hypothetical protein
LALPALHVNVTLEELKVDPGTGVSITPGPVAGGVGVGLGVGVGVGTGVAVGVGVGAGVGVAVGVGVGVGVGPDVPVSAAIKLAPLGVPQPVQRSYPEVAKNLPGLLRLVLSPAVVSLNADE